MNQAELIGYSYLQLLTKHRENIPFIFSLFGTLISSNYLFFEDQLSSFLFQATQGNWYRQINNCYFCLIKRAQTVFQVTETVSVIEAFNLRPNISPQKKINGYKIVFEDILTFDSKRKIFFAVIGLVSLLGYFLPPIYSFFVS